MAEVIAWKDGESEVTDQQPVSPRHVGAERYRLNYKAFLA